MERVRIAALFADKEQYGGASVTVCGWAKTIRDMKTFGFIELNDGSCFRNLQVVMDANSLSNYKEIAAQNVGAALIVRGTVVLTPEAKQPLEVKATEIEIEGVSSPDYPLQKKRHSVEYLRTIQHLRPRTNLFSAAFRVRSAAAYAVHEFFQSRGFVYVNTPIITGSDCEGAGEMFQVTTLDLENPPRTPDGKVDYSKDFFGKKTSLTVSGQLNAENFAMAFGDVYTFGPTFRAENSNTARHAAEFWMIEPEMAFCDLDGDLEVMEAMVKHIIRRVMERCPDDLAFFNSFVDKGLLERLQHVESSDFGRVTYTEAVKLLKESGQKFDYPVEWGIDLQTEHERYLTEQIFKRPVFVTDYPQEIKAFYMRLKVEQIIRDAGAVPATIAIIGGRLKAGLSKEEIDYLGRTGAGIPKASRRDLPVLVAQGKDGACTVTTTMMIADMAGIRVFATGGIGGVHRGAQETFDISADLEELANTSVMVVCAGAKSILDLGLTLEYLETHGVTVIGYGTSELPAFYTRKSGFGVDYELDTPEQLAKAFHVKRELGLRGGLLVTNPIPEEYSMDKEVIDKAIAEAVEDAKKDGIHGKATTPYLLAKIKDLTGGDSLDSNIQLVFNNARLGAAAAVELSKLEK